MSFKSKVLHTFYTRIFLLIFSLVSAVICARVLGPSDYGKGILLLLFPPIFVKFLNLGVAGSLTYYVNKNKENKDQYIGTALSFSILVSFAATALLLAAHAFIIDLYYKDEISKRLFLYVILFAPVYNFNLYFRSILKSLNQIETINYVTTILPTVLNTILVVVMIGLLKQGVAGYVYINFMVTTVVLLAMLIVLFRHKALAVAFDIHVFKEMISFGLRGFLANYTASLNEKMDKLLIGFFLAPSQVGIYDIAKNISSKLLIVPRSVGLPLYPHIAGMPKKEAAVFSRKLMNKLFVILLPIILASLALMPVAIQFLFGVEYSLAYAPAIFLCLETLFLSFNKILGYFFIGTGRPGIRSLQRLFALFTRCILMLCLVPRTGIVGCGMATLISSVATFGCVYYYFISREKVEGPHLFQFNIQSLKTIFKS